MTRPASSFHVEELTDDEMFYRLANENNSRGLSENAKQDTVELARKRILEDKSRCVISHTGVGNKREKKDARGRKHEHGSAACISAYLGVNIYFSFAFS